MKHKAPIDIPELLKLDGEPVGREELHYLYVSGPEKLSIMEISFLFAADPVTVFLHMEKNGVNNRVADSFIAVMGLDWMKQKTAEYYRAQAKTRIKMAEPQVEKVIVDGKTYIDKSMVKSYEQKIEHEIWSMMFDKPKKEFNRIRSVDLSAMRLHRGLDMFQFAQKADIPYKHVVYYEKTPDIVIPKEVSDIYFRVLNISNYELKKIKQVLSGKRKSMFEEEDRIIPTGVKNYVWDRDGGKCRECGTEKYLHFHHIHHYSDGGKHQARNLKLLCIACHALEHYGEPGYAMLKAKAEKLGVIVDGSRKASQECV